jgi:hypothetical protein
MVDDEDDDVGRWCFVVVNVVNEQREERGTARSLGIEREGRKDRALRAIRIAKQNTQE